MSNDSRGAVARLPPDHLLTAVSLFVISGFGFLSGFVIRHSSFLLILYLRSFFIGLGNIGRGSGVQLLE